MKTYIEQLLLLLLLHRVHGDSGCFFPESEVRAFFFEVPSSLPEGSVVADSVVDPPNAVLSLASVRANNLAGANFTSRFSLLSTATGRFSLVTSSPLALPSFPSSLEETFLYVTVVCNGQPYPLITVRVSAHNAVAPQFYGEPYVIEVEQGFGPGSVLDLPVVSIDWDPSPVYNVTHQLQDPKSPFIMSTLDDRVVPFGIDDVTKWAEQQKPRKLRLELTEEIRLPTVVKIVATDSGIPPKSTITSIRITEKKTKKIVKEETHFKAHASKIQKSVPLPLPSSSSSSPSGDIITSFSQCYMAAPLKENSPEGTVVARFTLNDPAPDTSMSLVDSDGAFSLTSSGDLIVADSRLIDRELFSSLEVVAQIDNASKDSACSRARLRVDLQDENDNRPVFEKEKYWFHLSDEIPTGTEFATIKARDIDEDENGHVSYRLLDSPAPIRLSIRGRDSVLLTAGEIGRDRQEVYHLVVEARDHGSPSRTSQVSVDVFVLRSKVSGRIPKEESPLIDLPALEMNSEKTTTEETTTTHGITEATTERAPRIEHTRRPPSSRERERPRFEPKKKSFFGQPVRGVVSAQIDPLPIGEERQQPVDDTTTTTTTTTAAAITTEDQRRPSGPSTAASPSPAHPTLLNNRISPQDKENTESEEEYFESGEESPFGFTSSHYFYEVFGDPAEDDVIGRVVAEPNPQMYGLDRKVAGIFKVDADIGELSVGRKLYSQSSGNISFEVSATDGESTARTVVTIFFDPARPREDVLPRFDQSLYKFRIRENASPEVLGIVRAFHPLATSRPSSSSPLHYDIISPSRIPFEVNQLSGEINNERALDHEEKANYDFKIRACLSSAPSICGVSSVVVSIDDVNDSAPRFASPLQHVTLPSDLPVGSEVIRVRAKDEDEGSNGAVSYALNPPSATFAIDYDSGSIVTISALTDSRYSILVEAFDHGVPKRSDATEIRIVVQGTNPSAPVFDQRVFEAALAGPVRAGSVVAQLHATDPDPGPEGTVTYHFEESTDPKIQKQQALFQINEKSGVVSAVSALSAFDGPFDLQVAAIDESTVFKRKTLASLHVEVIGDASLRFLPMPVTIYISTEKAVGSVVLRASALTSSTSPVHFRVLEDNSQFVMDGDLLRVATHLHPGRSSLTLRASSDSSHADHPLTVVVMSDRDKYPVFPHLTYDIDIPMEARFPLTVHRFDARLSNGTLRYEFYPEGAAPKGLLIEETTGELTVTSDYVREPTNQDTVFIVVRARNTLFPIYYSDVGVALIIVSRKPSIRFPQPIYRMDVMENTPVGSIIGVIEVFPKDSLVRYSLAPPTLFGVHPNGSFFVTGPLDIETLSVDRNGVLNYVITAESGSDRASAKVLMRIGDENEFSPEIEGGPLLEGRVREDALPGTTILRVRAKDRDFTEGTHLLYKIEGGSGRDLVFIQEDGTVILGDIPLDRESIDHFDLRVEVYDKRGNKASATALIKVDDANDNAPVIKDLPLKWEVPEGSTDVSFLVSAEDKDVGPNGEVHFKIIQGNEKGIFELIEEGHNKARLRLLRGLDREEQSSVLLTLEARDSGSPAHSTMVPLTVRVLDTNDNQPRFKQNEYKQKAPLDLPIGFPIVTATAKDSDGDRLDYDISGPGCSVFSIDPLGVVSFAVSVSRRRPSALICSISASDGTHRTNATLIVEIFESVQPTVPTRNRAPVFAQPDYSFVVDVPALLGKVSAVDPDGDQVLYSIRPAQYRNLFDVDAEGRVSLKVSRSELSQPLYSFLVGAEDWGPPIMGSVANVHVHVPENIQENTDSTSSSLSVISGDSSRPQGGRTPTTTPTTTTGTTTRGTTREPPKDLPIANNENIGPSPTTTPIIKFTRPMYMYSIRSDAAIGTYLGEVLLTFKKGVSLSLNETDRFSIDSLNRVRTTVEFDHQEKIEDLIVATYQGRQVATVPFVVHIIHSARPLVTVPDPRIGPTTTTTVTEGTTRVANVEATTEGTKTTERTTQPLPSLNLPTSESSETAVPTASSSSEFSFSRPIYFGFIPEGQYTNGVKVGVKPEPLATNRDGKVHYAIAASAQAMPFFLTEEGHLIAFDLDREQKSNYMIEIEARRSSFPSEIARSFLNVTVLDVNDNYPVFRDHPETFGVSRDAPVGSSVYRFQASDVDAEMSGEVQFEVEGDVNGWFSIDRHDGTLMVARPLLTAEQQLSFTVTARDMGRPALKTHQKIWVRLFDPHSPSPLLPSQIDTLSLASNATPGTLIATLLAGPNDNKPGRESILYGLADNYSGLFEIEDGGLLKLARRPMESEMGRIHQLNVTAENSLGVDSTLVNVLVEGATSTSAPSTAAVPTSTGCGFETRVYNTEIRENKEGRTLLTQVKSNCKGATYSIQDAPEEFSINPSTGEIFATKPLDREKKSLYFLYVNAVQPRVTRENPVIDNALSRLQSHQTLVVVRVVDENDSSPSFVHLSREGVVANVDSRARLLTPILRMQAKDLDEHPSLSYSLAGPDSSFFSLNSSSGLLVLSRNIEEEDKDSFRMTAAVSDGVHVTEVPVEIHRLSLSSNVIRLTSELPTGKINDYQVERTLNELLSSDSRVLGTQTYVDDNGKADAGRSHIFVYSIERESKKPRTKEKMMEMLSPYSSSLMSSPSRISSVSLIPSSSTFLGSTEIFIVLVGLALVALILVACCFLASHCKKKRYVSSADHEYVFGSLGAGPRPYDVEIVSRQTAQTVLAGRALPDPLEHQVSMAVSPAFLEGSISTNRSGSTKEFSNSVRERPSLLQSALARHKVHDGGLTATVELVPAKPS